MNALLDSKFTHLRFAIWTCSMNFFNLSTIPLRSGGFEVTTQGQKQQHRCHYEQHHHHHQWNWVQTATHFEEPERSRSSCGESPPTELARCAVCWVQRWAWTRAWLLVFFFFSPSPSLSLSFSLFPSISSSSSSSSSLSSSSFFWLSLSWRGRWLRCQWLWWWEFCDSHYLRIWYCLKIHKSPGLAARWRCEECNDIFCTACFDFIHGRGLKQTHAPVVALSWWEDNLATKLITNQAIVFILCIFFVSNNLLIFEFLAIFMRDLCAIYTRHFTFPSFTPHSTAGITPVYAYTTLGTPQRWTRPSRSCASWMPGEKP